MSEAEKRKLLFIIDNYGTNKQAEKAFKKVEEWRKENYGKIR